MKKQRNIQNIIIQLQIVREGADPQLDPVTEKFLVLSQAFAPEIGLGFYLNRKNFVFSLDDKIDLISCTIFSDMVCCLLSEWYLAASFQQRLQTLSSLLWI